MLEKPFLQQEKIMREGRRRKDAGEKKLTRSYKSPDPHFFPLPVNPGISGEKGFSGVFVISYHCSNTFL